MVRATAMERAARRTKLAEAQLEDVPPDGVEQLLALLLRRAPDALLQKERALLVAVREDAADEALRAWKADELVSGGRAEREGRGKSGRTPVSMSASVSSRSR